MQSLNILRAGALALLLGATGVAHAAGMRVVPLRLEMTAKGGTATLELTNLTPDNMGVQIDARRWQQDAETGADAYEDTQDLLFAPPIVAIPAGKTRTVRFRLRRGASADRELAYRVYVQQLAAPPDDNPERSTLAGGVEVRLRLGIPLFVAAIKPIAPQLTTAAQSLPSGQSALRLSNSGGTHLKLMQVEVLDASGKPVAETSLSNTDTNYLLAGSSSTWPLHKPGVNDAATLSPGAYTLRIKSDYYPARSNNGFSADGLTTRTLDF